ncbi:MAG: type IV secretion system DNA-binding domain-containing protein [Candidatus Saccharibacteria bacterium]
MQAGTTTYWLHTLSSVLPRLAVVFGVGIVLVLVIWLMIHLYTVIRLLRTEVVYLELTPSSRTDRVPEATSRLFTALHGLGMSQHWYERLLGRKEVFSMEIVSTRKDGIRFMVQVVADKAEALQQALVAYLSDIKVKVIPDYLQTAPTTKYRRVIPFKKSKHFAFPLQSYETLESHDPISYLTTAMTKLADNELMSFQLVMTPVRNREAEALREKILTNEDLLRDLNQRSSLVPVLTTGINSILFGLVDMVSGAFHEPTRSQFPAAHRHLEFKQQVARRIKPARTLTVYEHELVESIHHKLGQPLFRSEIRILLACNDKQELKKRRKSVEAALSLFAVPKYQSLKAKRMHFGVTQMYRQNVFTNRLPSIFGSSSSILAASEVASLYHFPNTTSAKTENLIRSLSKTLPAPVSLKNGTKLDVLIGENDHHGSVTPIGLTLKQRQKHTYIIGKTGTGKTTLLANSIYQDMVNGKGLAVLDPHGDMFQELLSLVPEHRQKDVIVFDPSDREFPLGLNMLDPGIEFTTEDDKYEWITSSVLSVFAKLADEHQWGPRMEHILRSATMTALQTPNPSLYTLQRLLTDKKYQKQIATTLKDPVLKQFWDKEFKLLGTMQLSNVTAPLTHRLGHFITTKMSRHILLQETSTLRIADIMNEGKILLVNLSKGDIGEDQSFFFGTILTSFIWMAAYQRTKIPEKQRQDFFVYIDEFQNFATPQFADITSEGRKFRVSLVVSHQNIAQIADQSILKVMVGNAATLVCLKASPEDETFILPYMKPEVDKGDIINLAPYHFYMKVTGDVSEDAFSGQTVPLTEEGSNNTMKSVLAYSRKHYGTPKASVERYMDKLFGSDKSKTDQSAAKQSKDAKEADSGSVVGT